MFTAAVDEIEHDESGDGMGEDRLGHVGHARHFARGARPAHDVHPGDFVRFEELQAVIMPCGKDERPVPFECVLHPLREGDVSRVEQIEFGGSRLQQQIIQVDQDVDEHPAAQVGAVAGRAQRIVARHDHVMRLQGREGLVDPLPEFPFGAPAGVVDRREPGRPVDDDERDPPFHPVPGREQLADGGPRTSVAGQEVHVAPGPGQDELLLRDDAFYRPVSWIQTPIVVARHENPQCRGRLELLA